MIVTLCKSTMANNHVTDEYQLFLLRWKMKYRDYKMSHLRTLLFKYSFIS
jgi:hypothetical protein